MGRLVMSKTWYTSDWHLGHSNILVYESSRIEYLGLSSSPTVEEMNEGLVRLWNSQVEPDDEVYVIGDMCMGKVNETIEYVGRLNGTKHLILGNHDRPHPGTTRNAEKRAEWERRYAEFFASQSIDGAWKFDDVYCRVSHFPYGGVDHTEGERYNSDMISQYTPVDNGRPLVHGHVHGLYQTRGPMFNVGIDAWGGKMATPEQIATYFRENGFA